jgi:hypothetical protein
MLTDQQHDQISDQTEPLIWSSSCIEDDYKASEKWCSVSSGINLWPTKFGYRLRGRFPNVFALLNIAGYLVTRGFGIAKQHFGIVHKE